MSACHCGNDTAFEDCCDRLHRGKPADAPEMLMRARFSAYKLGRQDFLLESWHRSTRPDSLSLGDGPEWTRLEVLDARSDQRTGHVHFRAIHRSADGWGYLEEHSRFVREDGRWWYLDGTTEQGRYRPGRNEPCPCGSGRKFKTCCLNRS